MREISTTVYLDAWEVLDQISDEQLIKELKDRKLHIASGYCPVAATEQNNPAEIYRAWVSELRETAREGDWIHFEILLLRMTPEVAREKHGELREKAVKS